MGNGRYDTFKKMNRIKNISKILIGLFVIIGSTVSFNYELISENKTETDRTELVLSKRKNSSKVIRFVDVQQLLSLHFAKPNICTSDQIAAIVRFSSNYLLEFNIQHHKRLEYKSLLLKIVLNDIIQQRNQWI